MPISVPALLHLNQVVQIVSLCLTVQHYLCDYTGMKKALLVLAWLPATALSLMLSVKLLTGYRHTRDFQALLAQHIQTSLPKSGFQFYASLPEVLGSFSVSVSNGDARPEIIRQFLKVHESPLEPYADSIIARSDAYQIDFRLITAISMCESNLGKKMPTGSYNAWGYAIYTGEANGRIFTNWEEAIQVLAEYLATRFYAQGLTTPQQIGPIYAPPSVETDNSWAKCVQKFMDELT